MTETTTTTTPLTDFNGFELAIGSVFGVRWFGVDREGRLRGRTYDAIWKPGENVAKCRRDEQSMWGSLSRLYMPMTYTYLSSTVSIPTPTAAASLSKDAVEERIDLTHAAPGDSCPCGFYAFAEGCDDKSYESDGTIMGVVECYGRVVLGTKGMRAEKARVVGLVGASQRTRELYPDVRNFRKRRWMLRRFDLIQPARRTPETDPNFWGASA